MEIPGIAPFSNQPTLTNPLPVAEQQRGQQTPELQESETQNTVSVSEQAPTSMTDDMVVNQANETEEAGFNPDNPGGTIDITA
ncbi:MAG: hypothetical protein JJU48_01985 [Methylophaga sp.]|nr:hypothetical protein [Methylophaga sp.]